MLNSTTKNRINSCRDMLVGKLPDPKSQIDQITNALVYKFMDDQDRMSRELGYDASFFIGDYEQYAWSKLFDNRLTNQEKANLYSEGLDKLSVADHLPELFKQIFKNARLPFKDPSTITMFLAEINGFSYHHSEELGNAFEYLLSVMGSQGDTGSFRTPRHIIEFLVDVVDPKRGETIYDPACGTAGFLIEAFNHIKSAGDLSVSDTATLGKNISGVDIDPGMAKIARVNLYLHGFKTPNIDENDTLSNEKLWGMKRDVILANPPFMTPKGGIRPHEKFSSKTSKSEVLFTDYIIEHLKLHGRAGIIVPEGIMFNGSNAYKDLRKKLVDGGYLWAVASLPSGVFNPYAGVKTSILFLDRERAKNNDSILFVKISADGYDLGAQRREINKNDLPKALEILNTYKENPNLTDSHPELVSGSLAHLVPKSKIAEGGDYNLSGDRYIAENIVSSIWGMVELGEICEVGDGNHSSNYPKASEMVSEGVIFIRSVNIQNNKLISNDIKYISLDKHKQLKKGWLKTNDVLFTNRGEIGKVALVTKEFDNANLNSQIAWLRSNDTISPKYLFHILGSGLIQQIVQDGQAGATLKQFTIKQLKDLKIPLPPLEIQEQIVAELDGYQRIIDGARAVVENYKPMIRIDPEWEMVELGDKNIIEILDGDRGSNYPKKEEFQSEGYCLFLNTSNVRQGFFDFSNCDFINEERDKKLGKGKLNKHDIILTTRGTLGNSAYFGTEIEYEHVRINSGMVILRSNLESVNPKYLLVYINSKDFESQVNNLLSGAAQPQLPIRSLSQFKIPLPSLEIQQSIVERIEEEQRLVDANRRLIEIYEQKIKEKMDEVWGVGK